MARRKKRKSHSFGMKHHSALVNRMAFASKHKKFNVKVDVSRARSAAGAGPIFLAVACVTGMTAPYMKGEHCSSLRGGASPTKAAANALRELSEGMTKYGR